MSVFPLPENSASYVLSAFNGNYRKIPKIIQGHNLNAADR